MFAQQKEYDFLIKKALIFDGKSLDGFRGDVAIEKDRIVAIAPYLSAKAKQIIDAKEWVLAPGFIDAHTHSDFNPLLYPDLPNKILQGVTTEVVGNCGMSAAPVLGTHRERIRGVWAREGVGIPEKTISWNSFEEYRAALESKGMSGNFVGLIGHGNLRSAVMGFAPHQASESEILQMKKLLGQAMKQGASGISFGLVYLPGIFANEEELVALCREAARHNGVCAFHMRNEGSKLLEAIQEAIRIGQKAQATIQISHLKAGGKANWGKIDEAFKLIESARLAGMPVEADAYPYAASFAELGVILPDAIYQREDRVSLFKSLEKREELLETLRKHYEDRNMKWDTIMIAATPHKKYWKYEGKTIRDIARETGKSPEQFLVEILAGTSFEVSAFSFSQSEEVVDRVIEKPYVAVGSDSIADGSRKPHPRAFGSFPKIFKRYEIEKKEIETGEAVRKMTSLVAEHFRLKERGQIKPGFFADLVLFDPKKISDQATYEKPDLPSRGIEWVFVNGRPVVRNGKPTRIKAGRFLS